MTENEGLKKWRAKNATERKDAIVDAVVTLTERLDMAPLRAEVAEFCEMDIKTARRWIGDLIDEGILEEPGGPRTRTLRLKK